MLLLYQSHSVGFQPCQHQKLLNPLKNLQIENGLSRASRRAKSLVPEQMPVKLWRVMGSVQQT